MTESGESGDLLERQLWNVGVTPASYPTNEQYQDHLLKQYELYVNSAHQVSDRRNTANTFFLTLHTLILGMFAIILQGKFRLDPSWLIMFPVIGGVALCWIWGRLLVSYRQLNAAKFKVIGAIETRLPVAPFVAAEWHVLGEGKDKKLYRPLTPVERTIPWVFAFLYVSVALVYMFSSIRFVETTN
jgi:hypothetical protein